MELHSTKAEFFGILKNSLYPFLPPFRFEKQLKYCSEKPDKEDLHFSFPSRLREGLGWAVSAARDLAHGIAPKAKYNKIVKIRKADFYRYVPQSGTYRVGAADISYEIYRAEGISCALWAQDDRAHYFPTFGK